MLLHIFPLSFRSIMYFLSGQIGLISITLRQNGINSPLTSLPGHRWQMSFSQSNKMSGGSVKPVWLSLSHLCSGVFSNIHFISHSSPINFLQKMNSSPLAVNTGITENYKRWNQLLNKTVIQNAGCLSGGCTCHLASCLFFGTLYSNITLREIKVIPCCIDRCSLVFHGHSQLHYWLKNSCFCMQSSLPSCFIFLR